MNTAVILATSMIGFAAGLRAFTAPAVVAWCAYLGWITLVHTPFSFVQSPIAVAFFSIMACGEYVWDLLPNTPNRTALPGLTGRVLTGTFAAAGLLAATNNNLALCVLGAIAAIAGAFGGMIIRIRTVKALAVNDAFVAIPEDIIAIGMALTAVFLLITL